jgi:beta-aspartyl-peptidase (threonine type)
MSLGNADPAWAQNNENKGNGKYTIVIHGGALGDVAAIKPEQQAAGRDTLTKALTIGKQILERDGTSLDAVEQVIRFLEDDPTFNAGRGAVFNAAGGHELDASIMDGATKQCGAVASVKTVKNPISLARLVMLKTRHVLLAGEGAEQFATEMQIERVENKYFSTPARFEEWQKSKSAKKQKSTASQEPHKGTVGCVALDRHGHLAAGTSTGGLTNKMFGRVGDSPIIGAGTYADDSTCAVSCTGIGEQFIRNSVAYDVSAQMRYQKKPLQDAVATIIQQTLKKGDGGIIAVGANGDFTMQFNTGGMARAVATSDGKFEVQYGP